jgi:hypothetical protein
MSAITNALEFIWQVGVTVVMGGVYVAVLGLAWLKELIRIGGKEKCK